MSFSSNRYIEFDIIRIIACALVVLAHAPMPTVKENGFFVTALGFFTAPSIGLFFMISGALILPIKKSPFIFLKSRLFRIGIPLLIWTGFYIFLNIYNSLSEINIYRIIFSIPFSNQGQGVFWFLYVILGLYIITPILSLWLQSATKKEIEFYLFLWVITLCYSLLDHILIINDSNTSILFYVSGYIGYYILGYYMKKYNTKRLGLICLGIGILGICMILFFKTNNIVFDFFSLFWFLSIFMVSWCIVYWKFIIRVSRYIERFMNKKILTQFANLTFGVYLIHIFIMREILWKSIFVMSISNYYIQTLTIYLISLFSSFLGIYIISKIPWLRIIIGFSLEKIT